MSANITVSATGTAQEVRNDLTALLGSPVSGGSAGSGSGSAGSGTGTPGDTGSGSAGGSTGSGAVFVYKTLTMADALAFAPGVYPNIAPGEIVLGDGPREIALSAGVGVLAWLGRTTNVPMEFGIWITDQNGRHHVAHDVHVTGWGWQGDFAGLQRVTVRGAWGDVTKVEFVTDGIGWPDYHTLLSPTFDGLPLFSNREGSSNTFVGGGSGSSGDAAYVFTLVPVVSVPVPGAPPPPSSTATPSVISGVTVDGVAVAADTLKNIINGVQKDGAVVVFPEGRFIGTTTVPRPMTIRGAGKRKTIFDCTGLTPAFSKAVFVPMVPGVVFEDFDVTGAAVSDNNGAGIRDENYNNVGAGFEANRVSSYGNQEGWLTFGGRYKLTACDTHDDGAGDGQSHDQYFGGQHSGTGYVELNDHVAYAPLGGHAFKSREPIGRINGGSFTSGGDAAAVNLPVAGDYKFDVSPTTGLPAEITADTTLANHALLQYGVDWFDDVDSTNVDAAGNGLVGKTLVMGPTIFITKGQNAAFIQGPKWATIDLTGTKYQGPKPDMSNWRGTIIGDMTPVA